MDPDDVAYRKSVRNMSLVLAAIVITIIIALAASPYVFPAGGTLRSSAESDSAFGFTMHLQVNATEAAQGSAVLITGWLNNTSGQINNVTAADSWGVAQGGLWTRVCTLGWPVGVGVMKGHYSQDNYTLGTLMPVPSPKVLCPAVRASPSYFLFEGHSSTVLVDLAGAPAYWRLQTSYGFTFTSQPGVYTAVFADEWGDVLTANFAVS